MKTATYVSHSTAHQPDKRTKKYKCHAIFKTEDDHTFSQEIRVPIEGHNGYCFHETATLEQISETLIPYIANKAKIGYSIDLRTLCDAKPAYYAYALLGASHSGWCSSKEEAFNKAKEDKVRQLTEEIEKVSNATFKA
jgi:hypothetical protein